MRLDDDMYEREARAYLARHGFEELRLGESECRNMPRGVVYLLPGHIRFMYYGTRIVKPDIALLNKPTVMRKRGDGEATVYVMETSYIALSDNNMQPVIVKRSVKNQPQAQLSPLNHLFVEKEEGLTGKLFGNIPERLDDPLAMA